MKHCTAMCLGLSGLFAAGCASSSEPIADGSGETITLAREMEPNMLEAGFAVVDRRAGWMRYIVIEPGGYTVEPPPGAAEVDHFQPEAVQEVNRVVTDQNQDTQTPRPLLRR